MGLAEPVLAGPAVLVFALCLLAAIGAACAFTPNAAAGSAAPAKLVTVDSASPLVDVRIALRTGSPA
jgi:hypothetical protein